MSLPELPLRPRRSVRETRSATTGIDFREVFRNSTVAAGHSTDPPPPQTWPDTEAAGGANSPHRTDSARMCSWTLTHRTTMIGAPKGLQLLTPGVLLLVSTKGMRPST